MLVVRIPTTVERSATVIRRKQDPALWVDDLGLSFVSLDGDGIASANRLLGYDAEDQRGAVSRAELDQENLANFSGTARNATHHSLAQTRVEAAAQENQIRDASWLDGYNRGRGRCGVADR